MEEAEYRYLWKSIMIFPERKKEKLKMKKNTTLLALALIALLAFTGCSKNDNGADTATPTPVVEENITDTTDDTTTDDTTADDTTADEEASVDDTADAGVLTSNEVLDAIHQRVIDLVGEENYVANMPYDATALSELFGVDPSWYDAAIADGPLMSVHVDKFIAIHATEGNVENVANALNEYRDILVADTMQYPMNVAKIQGSVVETVGDYVFLSMIGYVDDMEQEESDLINAYTEINTQVIDIAKEEIGA